MKVAQGCFSTLVLRTCWRLGPVSCHRVSQRLCGPREVLPRTYIIVRCTLRAVDGLKRRLVLHAVVRRGGQPADSCGRFGAIRGGASWPRVSSAVRVVRRVLEVEQRPFATVLQVMPCEQPNRPSIDARDDEMSQAERGKEPMGALHRPDGGARAWRTVHRLGTAGTTRRKGVRRVQGLAWSGGRSSGQGRAWSTISSSSNSARSSSSRSSSPRRCPSRLMTGKPLWLDSASSRVASRLLHPLDRHVSSRAITSATSTRRRGACSPVSRSFHPHHGFRSVHQPLWRNRSSSYPSVRSRGRYGKSAASSSWW